MIIDRPDIWEGIVPREEVVNVFVETSMENCQFWRDCGFADRALWFAWNVLKVVPARVDIWMHLLKSFAKTIPAGRGIASKRQNM